MHTVDALVESTDEGRAKLRYATGSCLKALIRRFPNKVISPTLSWTLLTEYIG